MAGVDHGIDHSILDYHRDLNCHKWLIPNPQPQHLIHHQYYSPSIRLTHTYKALPLIQGVHLFHLLFDGETFDPL